MKKTLAAILFFGILGSFYACSGECVKCNKIGSQTLRYCESDFPSAATYHDQINTLDSLGYDCFEK